MKIRLALLFFLMLAMLVPPAEAQSELPWFIGLDNGVYRSKGGTYQRVGLGSATDLAVHGDTPYVIGNDQGVWTSPGGDGTWAPTLPGVFGRCLAADVDGSLCIVGVDSGVYRAREGHVTRLGLAMASDVSADRGTFYVIGIDSQLWFTQDGSNWKLFQPLAFGTRVSAANGRVFIIGMEGGVYRVTPNSLERLGLATAVDLAASPEGVPYIVGIDGYVWRYVDDDWSRYGYGQARAIAFPR